MSLGIAVMAKAPRPGFSKTRLIGAVSPEQAARLSAAFLADVLENIRCAAQTHAISPYVAFAPKGAEAAFNGIVPPGTQMLLADGGIPTPPGIIGFGACLLHAIQTQFALGHEAAGVLNADSPNLPTSLLRQAAEILAEPGDRAVLGPADDGGYFFLGLKKPHAALFAHIDWSSPQVAAQTRARAASIGLPLIELQNWYDVDEPAMLTRLLADLRTPPAGAFAAPQTTALVAAANLGVLHAGHS